LHGCQYIYSRFIININCHNLYVSKSLQPSSTFIFQVIRVFQSYHGIYCSPTLRKGNAGFTRKQGILVFSPSRKGWRHRGSEMFNSNGRNACNRNFRHLSANLEAVDKRLANQIRQTNLEVYQVYWNATDRSCTTYCTRSYTSRLVEKSGHIERKGVQLWAYQTTYFTFLTQRLQKVTMTAPLVAIKNICGEKDAKLACWKLFTS